MRARLRVVGFAAAAAAALAAGLAPPASARPIVELDAIVPGHLTGPRLAGDRVVWAQTRIGDWTIRSWRDGDVDAEAEIPSAWPLQVGFATSPQVLAYQNGLDLFAGFWGPSPPPVDRMCGNGGRRGAIAASGARVAAVVACRDAVGDSRAEQLVFRVRDLASRTAQDVLVEAETIESRGRDGVRLAGDALAVIEQVAVDADRNPVLGIAVHDLATGTRRVAYPGGALRAWDLRADGSVAVATGDALGWIDPAGAWHEVLGAGIAGERLRFVGDRLAVALPRAAAPGARRTLALVSLDGRVRPVARFDGTGRRSGAPRLVDFDFDGERVTWAERRCRGAVTLHLVDADAAARRPGRSPAARRCRAGLAR